MNGNLQKSCCTTYGTELLLFVLLCVAFFFSYNNITTGSFDEIAIDACQLRLKNVWCAIEQYRGTFEEYPPDLNQAGTAFHLDARTSLLFFSCRGKGKKLKQGDKLDYLYVNWSRFFSDAKELPGDFPLCWDRLLSNHDGDGVNVVTVNSRVYFDKEAQGLRHFATKHPEYDIPLPEDLAPQK